MGRYGLIGVRLSHSFSKVIHDKIDRYDYELMPMSSDELCTFLRKHDFSGINVTIPYKTEAMQFCTDVDIKAKEIGSVNCIVNRKGKIYGYNTDYNGFLYALQKNNIDASGKCVYILGSGATAHMAQMVFREQEAAEIFIVSRELTGEGVISYTEALERHEAHIIVNATPVGTSPNNGDCPIDIDCFDRLEAVVDVIYNPIETRLLKNAKEKGVTAVSGLLMLVAQAVYAAELFLDEPIGNEKIDEIYRELRYEMRNIVLVGMPGSGKTALGQRLYELFGQPLIDIDALIEQRSGMSVQQIFEESGEGKFRWFEHEAILDASTHTGAIIVTGGGAVLDRSNIEALKQNGVVIFVDRELDKLTIGKGRPLSSDKAAVAELYEQRYPIYLEVSDAVVKNNGRLTEVAKVIDARFHAFIFK